MPVIHSTHLNFFYLDGMENIRNNYPALENFVYLNSCSSGLFSKQLVAHRHRLDLTFQQKGSNFRAGVYGRIDKIKGSVAAAFGAEPTRTALIPSCSIGLNLVLEALADGQRVLHLKNDYPSIVWPFESRNFRCISIPNRSYSAEELIRQIQEHQIDILALSVVQYSNGNIIAPVTFQAVKQACPEVLIIADATQFLGTAPFHFEESGIDLFAASAFKWLCAGYGNGLLFFSKAIARALESKTRGYNTYKNPRMEGNPTLGEYFEPGHQDLLVFETLAFQVEHHLEIGFDIIQAQIKRVKTYLREKIAGETPYQVITSINPHLESGILSVDAPRELVQDLNQNGIVCSYNRGLRLGIHFYNNIEDANQLLAFLSRTA